MPNNSIAVTLAVGFITATSACVAARGQEPIPIEVGESTVRIEGWFAGSKIEWILFPMKDFNSYYPYDRKENEKCVSLINGTGAARAKFTGFEGRKVALTGVAVRYYDLVLGTSDADRLLAKRYYENVLVENWCLRDFIFVVREIMPE